MKEYMKPNIEFIDIITNEEILTLSGEEDNSRSIFNLNLSDLSL